MVVWRFSFLIRVRIWRKKLATPKTALKMESGMNGVRGAAALAVELGGWAPDRGHALLQSMEGRTVLELMRRQDKPAMSRKPVVLAQWTLLLLTELS